jgi:hypothetical protein
MSIAAATLAQLRNILTERIKSPPQAGHPWYEPDYELLSLGGYHMYACGSAYVLSKTAVVRVFGARRPFTYRMLGNEDTSMGLLMLAHDLTFFEDLRLCASMCHASQAFVVVHGRPWRCGDLSDPSAFKAISWNRNCSAVSHMPLPFIRSSYDRFNKMIQMFFGDASIVEQSWQIS